MITVGTHTCIVLPTFNGWFAESGESNTPSIRLNLKVTEGECKGEEVEYHGWLTEKAMDRTLKTLEEAFGWDGDLEALAKLVSTGPFAGKPCKIVTEMEEYRGKKTVKVKWLNGMESSGAGSHSVSPERAMEIARRLSRKPAPPRRGGQDLGLADDSVPF